MFHEKNVSLLLRHLLSQMCTSAHWCRCGCQNRTAWCETSSDSKDGTV